MALNHLTRTMKVKQVEISLAKLRSWFPLIGRVNGGGRGLGAK